MWVGRLSLSPLVAGLVVSLVVGMVGTGLDTFVRIGTKCGMIPTHALAIGAGGWSVGARLLVGAMT